MASGSMTRRTYVIKKSAVSVREIVSSKEGS
jgi:hypothetical protein